MPCWDWRRALLWEPISRWCRPCTANRIFLSGFFANGIFAVFLCYFGYRLGIDLYYVALIAFGLRIFNNIAIIRRLLMGS